MSDLLIHFVHKPLFTILHTTYIPSKTLQRYTADVFFSLTHEGVHKHISRVPFKLHFLQKSENNETHHWKLDTNSNHNYYKAVTIHQGHSFPVQSRVVSAVNST